ncbi:methylated-DNA--[protein]-cysteine S-methyltransferase [Longimicrobium sp.]|uniref:methylated-DNA--[protein]-cysteine S-methyltransferase n=1 Tax=Longimicrobium sp. TaxID=2029185 RepID=UPI002C5AD504|nr:methylated-DNA--[protein]-cysteine S-methyltransferase [Longimicrobium sp.]HSU15140.1 methylated-DNA--[protein]-cysteine S-methyltransferase [Longimicrobium sp.]
MPVSDYDRIAQAIRFIEQNHLRQPTLDEVARSVFLSEFHFQRLFRRWVGISPKRFLQFLTIEHAKRRLDECRSVLDATYDAGLSSPGRLHDLFVTLEAVTPGEYKQKGAGLRISYGFHETPFGTALLGATARGLCSLAFVDEGGEGEAIDGLRERWELADLDEDARVTAPLAARIFAPGERDERPIPLFVQGTNHQVRVWEALLRVPAGAVVSYEQLAAAAGRPDAVRAVAGAVARNQIAYVIPCHRVIRKLGAFGGYRWGTERKQAMLCWEAARVLGDAGEEGEDGDREKMQAAGMA